LVFFIINSTSSLFSSSGASHPPASYSYSSPPASSSPASYSASSRGLKEHLQTKFSKNSGP